MAKAASSSPARRIRPATTPEARENQLISLAFDTAERRMQDGTASSAEIVHFLKMGSAKYKLELEKTKVENELAQAKKELIDAQKDSGEKYVKAIEAMKKYSGYGGEETYEDESEW